MDIHNNERKYTNAITCVERSMISERNKQLILDFVDANVLDGISKPRLCRYLSALKRLGEDLEKDFDKVTMEDLKRYVSKMQQGKLRPWTKRNL